jgi:hypothetical protein
MRIYLLLNGLLALNFLTVLEDWGAFYNPRLFGTELRMTDQVKYLGVILDKNLD